MAEEHGCEAPEGHRLCVNNCGFFGSTATMNLCSKCYRDFSLRKEKESSIKSTMENSLFSLSSSSPAVEPISSPAIIQPDVVGDVEITVAVASVAGVAEAAAAAQPSRCSACRKRVGLTGFKCRCGTTFCGVHRYPEKHDCAFDFKKMGREEITKANPVIKGQKLERI